LKEIWLIEHNTTEVAKTLFELETAVSMFGGHKTVRLSYLDAVSKITKAEEVVLVIAFSWKEAIDLSTLFERSLYHPSLLYYPSMADLHLIHRDKRYKGYFLLRHEGEQLYLRELGYPAKSLLRLSGQVFDAEIPDSSDTQSSLVVAYDSRYLTKLYLDQIHQLSPSQWINFVDNANEPDTQSTLLPDVYLEDPWYAKKNFKPFAIPVVLTLQPLVGWSENYLETELMALRKLKIEQRFSLRDRIAWRYSSLNYLLTEKKEVTFDGGLFLKSYSTVEEELKLKTVRLDAKLKALDVPERMILEPERLDSFFQLYDLLIQLLWLGELLTDLKKIDKRLGALTVLNTFPLYFQSNSWLLKRLLKEQKPLFPMTSSQTSLKKLRFLWSNKALFTRFFKSLLQINFKHDPKIDLDNIILSQARAIAQAVLTDQNITISKQNSPQFDRKTPVLYLMSHRNAQWDPFVMMASLPSPISIVLGPRIQRFPLLKALGKLKSFVLTGQEKGVVLADAIAAIRNYQGLVLYPEVAEPSYLGEAAPIRPGLLWILEALSTCQIIPVYVDDLFESKSATLSFGEALSVPPLSSSILDVIRYQNYRHFSKARALVTVLETSLDTSIDTSLESIILEEEITVEPPSSLEV
jgi:hypothetical protein